MIAAVLGTELEGGEFQVLDVCLAGMPTIQQPLPSMSGSSLPIFAEPLG